MYEGIGLDDQWNEPNTFSVLSTKQDPFGKPALEIQRNKFLLLGEWQAKPIDMTVTIDKDSRIGTPLINQPAQRYTVEIMLRWMG